MNTFVVQVSTEPGVDLYGSAWVVIDTDGSEDEVRGLLYAYLLPAVYDPNSRLIADSIPRVAERILRDGGVYAEVRSAGFLPLT